MNNNRCNWKLFSRIFLQELHKTVYDFPCHVVTVKGKCWAKNWNVYPSISGTCDTDQIRRMRGNLLHESCEIQRSVSTGRPRCTQRNRTRRTMDRWMDRSGMTIQSTWTRSTPRWNGTPCALLCGVKAPARSACQTHTTHPAFRVSRSQHPTSVPCVYIGVALRIVCCIRY